MASGSAGSGPKVKKRSGPKSKTSPYLGVTQYRKTGRWEAHIWLADPKGKGGQKHLGSYHNAEEAARCYDRAAIKTRGPRAELNFPYEQYREDAFLQEHLHLGREPFFRLMRETFAIKSSALIPTRRAAPGPTPAGTAAPEAPAARRSRSPVTPAAPACSSSPSDASTQPASPSHSTLQQRQGPAGAAGLRLNQRQRQRLAQGPGQARGQARPARGGAGAGFGTRLWRQAAAPRGLRDSDEGSEEEESSDDEDGEEEEEEEEEGGHSGSGEEGVRNTARQMARPGASTASLQLQGGQTAHRHFQQYQRQQQRQQQLQTELRLAAAGPQAAPVQLVSAGASQHAQHAQQLGLGSDPIDLLDSDDLLLLENPLAQHGLAEEGEEGLWGGHGHSHGHGHGHGHQRIARSATAPPPIGMLLSKGGGDDEEALALAPQAKLRRVATTLAPSPLHLAAPAAGALPGLGLPVVAAPAPVLQPLPPLLSFCPTPVLGCQPAAALWAPLAVEPPWAAASGAAAAVQGAAVGEGLHAGAWPEGEVHAGSSIAAAGVSAWGFSACQPWG